MSAGISAVTDETAKRVLFGAGTIHRGLRFKDGGWNFAETFVGSTNEGTALRITPVLQPVSVDGAWTANRLFTRKVGETAELEISFAELTADILQAETLGMETESDVPGYKRITASPELQQGDIWENIAFAGVTLDGLKLIVILPNAVCTSGFQLQANDGDSPVYRATFACHSAENDPRALPWTIYTPENH